MMDSWKSHKWRLIDYNTLNKLEKKNRKLIQQYERDLILTDQEKENLKQKNETYSKNLENQKNIRIYKTK